MSRCKIWLCRLLAPCHVVFCRMNGDAVFGVIMFISTKSSTWSLAVMVQCLITKFFIMLYRLPIWKWMLQKNWTLAFLLSQRKVEASKSPWHKSLSMLLEEHVILHNPNEGGSAFATLMAAWTLTEVYIWANTKSLPLWSLHIWGL